MTFLAIVLFLFWCYQGSLFMAAVFWRVPRLTPGAASLTAYPKVSIIFAARNEEQKIRDAVCTMLNQDYPDFEVIAVNDRSSDQTLAILEDLARTPQASRLKVFDIQKLPANWLGKNHALYQGFLASSGEWLLFTDADVHFDPGTLKAALQTVSERKLDHLVLFPYAITKSYLEALFMMTFTFVFYLWFRPWAARNPRSQAYVGIGSFNLVRREVYEKIGTHQAIALEVTDDMMLGREVKKHGFRQMLMDGTSMIWETWVEGWKGILNSLEKNGFAGLHYNLFLLIGATLGLLIFDMAPFFLIFVTHGGAQYCLLGVIGIFFLMHCAVQKYFRYSLITFPAHPFGSLLILFLVWRSAVKTLWQGGVKWRDTFYPLEILKKK